MGANSFLTDDIITLEALSILEANSVSVKHSMNKSSEFGPHDGSNRGDNIRIRKPPLYTVRSGATWTQQGITDDYVNLTVNLQRGIDTQFTSAEMKQDLSSFSDQILKPQISRLAREVDSIVLGGAVTAVPNYVGTPGTTPSTIAAFLAAGTTLDNNLAPRDGQRRFVVGPTTQASAVDALKAIFNPQGGVSSQNKTGEIGDDFYGFDVKMSQNIPMHTTGALGGTPLSNGATQTGASIVCDGGSASITGYFKAGDVITFAGTEDVDLVTKESLGVLKQFVVTADANTDGSGNVTVSIYPPVVATGSLQNVSQAIADNSAIQTFGAVSSTGGVLACQNVLWHKNALAVAFQELPKPQGVDMAATKTDKQLGLSMRLIRWYDGDDDLFKVRFDILFGFTWVRPEWACRLVGGAR